MVSPHGFLGHGLTYTNMVVHDLVDDWLANSDGPVMGIYISGWWYTYPCEKYYIVSWDDEIPNIWKNKSHVPNHQPDIFWYIMIMMIMMILLTMIIAMVSTKTDSSTCHTASARQIGRRQGFQGQVLFAFQQLQRLGFQRKDRISEMFKRLMGVEMIQGTRPGKHTKSYGTWP